MGYTLLTEGLTGEGANNDGYTTPGNISLGSGDPINVTLYYANGNLAIAFKDTANGVTFSTNVSVDLPSVVGGYTAYIGFTSGDGGAASTQIITNFVFYGLVPD
ncbi:MAG: hypothetical protein KGJ60_12870 [Verrucomicrobiota bacterium]|nr:hypothetical protein [Verrucomicrobiota bacterium]